MGVFFCLHTVHNYLTRLSLFFNTSMFSWRMNLKLSKNRLVYMKQLGRKPTNRFVKNARGFTLVEVIVVLATVAILFGLIARMMRPPHVTVFANDLAAVIQQSRYESVQRNSAVAVVLVQNKGFEVRTIPGRNATCSATDYQVLRSLNFQGHGSVNVSMNKTGIIWLPNGLVLACDGTQPFVNVNIFDNSGKTRALTINSIGRVEIQ